MLFRVALASVAVLIGAGILPRERGAILTAPVQANQTNSPSTDGRPANVPASCEIDLTGDQRADLVLLIETARGTELIVLVPGDRDGAYATFVLSSGPAGGLVKCQTATEVRETRAGRSA
jgi:hypothetical protein